MNLKQLPIAAVALILGGSHLAPVVAQAHVHLPSMMETVTTSPYFSGINLTCNARTEWVNEPQFHKHFSTTNAGALRLPGGTFSNSYDWKSGLARGSRLMALVI